MELSSVDVNYPYLYLGSWYAGLITLDISTPSFPQNNGANLTISNGTDVASSNDHVYIIPYHAGLEIFDHTLGGNPTNAVHIPVANQPYDAAIDGNYMYAASDEGSYFTIKTIDISDPSNAFVASEFETSAGMHLIKQGGNIIAAMGGGNLEIIDASDPLNLSLTTSIPYTGSSRRLEFHGSVLYVSTYSASTTTIDIYTVNPCCTHENTFSMSGMLWDFTISGSVLYVKAYDKIEIYNIANPLSPVYVDTYTPIGLISESEAYDDRLYIIEYDRLEIADISDPLAPVLKGSVEISIGNDFKQIAFWEIYAIIEGEYLPPYAVSVIPSSNPANLGQLYTHDPYEAYQLLVSDGYMYEITIENGIRVHGIS